MLDVFYGFYFFIALIRSLIRKKSSFLLKKVSTKNLPKTGGKKVIWIHAVSVGEAKAAGPFLKALQKREKETFFLVTTTTETGQKEAMRSLKEADAILPMPLDFRWVVRAWVAHFQPHLFFMIETDFWPQLLDEVRRVGGKCAVVSGKMSEKTANRFNKWPRLGKWLFSKFDAVCVQTLDHEKRFSPFISKEKLQISGNLKFELEPEPVDEKVWQEKFGAGDPWVAITCTHEGEEKLILEALDGLNLRFFLAPRHPERFESVAKELEVMGLCTARWSEEKGDKVKVVLVDIMGQLPILYRLSQVAILGGSFIEKVGGHNVLEPCLYGCYPFFGPFMEGQTEIAAKVLEAKAGAQKSLKELKAAVKERLDANRSPEERKVLFSREKGPLQKTLEALEDKKILSKMRSCDRI